MVFFSPTVHRGHVLPKLGTLFCGFSFFRDGGTFLGGGNPWGGGLARSPGLHGFLQPSRTLFFFQGDVFSRFGSHFGVPASGRALVFPAFFKRGGSPPFPAWVFCCFAGYGQLSSRGQGPLPFLTSPFFFSRRFKPPPPPPVRTGAEAGGALGFPPLSSFWERGGGTSLPRGFGRTARGILPFPWVSPLSRVLPAIGTPDPFLLAWPPSVISTGALPPPGWAIAPLGVSPGISPVVVLV